MPLKRLTRPEPLPTAPLRIAFLRDHPCPIHPWQNESPRMNAAIPERRPATEEISGVMERVTFHNDDSGFCVLRVKTKGHREETTVVGSLPSVTAGEWLVAVGCWVRDRKHGAAIQSQHFLRQGRDFPQSDP